MILSGHYHGGVMQLPGIGGVISPDFTLFPKYSGGIYREGTQTVVVSRGLGNTFCAGKIVELAGTDRS